MALLKTLHVMCAVLWLGNFAVTGVWSIRAFTSRQALLRRFAAREILFTDVVFTLIFGAAVIISGLRLASVEAIAPLATAWTRDALFVSVLAGLAWLAVLLPLELRMKRLTETEIGDGITTLFLWWNIAGWLLTLALFGVIYLMVAKPT